jgi:outer membrane protein TolC
MDVSRGIGSPDGGLDPLLGGWRVGLRTSYALDHRVESASAASADLSTQAAWRDVRELEVRITAEVRRLFRAWQAADNAVTIQEETMRLAEREAQLAELRYERGLASRLDPVGAETSLLQAQNALIMADLDRRLYALDLQRAVGRLRPQAFQ